MNRSFQHRQGSQATVPLAAMDFRKSLRSIEFDIKASKTRNTRLSPPTQTGSRSIAEQHACISQDFKK